MEHRWQAALIAALVACAARSGVAQSEGTPVEIARSIRIESAALKETRVVDVTLPAGYDSGQRYPVVIVLDGEFEHEIAAATARFFASVSQLPPVIVVGVRNTRRMRDLTPAAVAGFTPPPEAQGAGGADPFLDFLGTELLPYLDRTYSTAPMRVLVGHSLGGLFALHALTRRAELFTGYVVMEPSTWWNRQHELEQARRALRSPATRRARVMMVNGQSLEADTTGWGGDRAMVREIRVTGETHGSMALAGMMAGLRAVFADFLAPTWKPGTRPIAMLARYDSLAHRVGYQPPIPSGSFALVARMSLDSRFFDDAGAVLDRMERTLGATPESQRLRERFDKERSTPTPAGVKPLVIPARRPNVKEAAPFLGRWISAEGDHEIDVRAAGDTIVVRDRIRNPANEWDEGAHPVIQVTADGTLEWGLPWFRGLAALLVLQGRVSGDTMEVTREVRGWLPRGPAADLARVQQFRRVTAAAAP